MIKELLGDVLVEADCGVEGEVFLGLDELQSVGDVGNGGHSEEALAQ